MTHRTAWAVKGSLSSARLLAALCKAASCPRSLPLPDLLPEPPRASFLLCWQSPGAALRGTQPPRYSQEPQGEEEFLPLQEVGIEGRGVGEGAAPSHQPQATGLKGLSHLATAWVLAFAHSVRELGGAAGRGRRPLHRCGN